MASSAGGNEDLKGALAALDEKYAGAQVTGPDTPVPDGRYHVDIESVVLKRSGGGDPMLEYTFVIVSEGPHQGRKVWYHRTITEKTLKWVKQELVVCGLNIARISEVAEHLPSLTKARLDITIRTKNEHRNIYFNRRLDLPEGGANVIEAGDKTDDFLP